MNFLKLGVRFHMHVYHICTLFYFLKYYLFIFRERGSGEEREGEKHRCERETSIGCFSHTPDLGPGRVPSALTRNGTGDLLVCRMMPNPLSHTSQGCICIF